MGAIDVKFWGSMGDSFASFQHEGDGPGSFRATAEKAKAFIDEVADMLEQNQIVPDKREGG